MKWPERTYLLDREHRFVYCPIPKVAMTSLKLWMLLVADARTDPHASYEEVSARLRKRAGFGGLRLREARAVLRDPSVFKFVFVRNPWSRLVSAYLNKFLTVRHEAREVIDAVRETECGAGRSRAARSRWTKRLCRTLWRGRERDAVRDVPAGITFRQFVDYLSSREPHTLNRHWRPQHLFLGAHTFDFVGKLERLDEDFARVRRRLDIETPLPHRNPSSYPGDAAGARRGECLADCPPERLHERPGYPGYRSFYTRDLAEVVAAVYAEDIRRFGYEF